MAIYEEETIGIKCIKYLLYLSNFLFVMTAFLIISVGTTIYAVYSDFNEFLEAKYFSPALFLILIGFLILLVSLFGLMGTLRESTCMIMIFSVSLGFILLLEIIAAMAAYNLPGGVGNFIANNMKSSMSHYNENGEDMKAIDFLQTNLNCCGIKNYKDWQAYEPFNQTHEFPASCYDDDQMRTSGCLSKLSNLVYQSSLMIGTGALSVALVQALGMAFACMLGKSIRRAKTEREIRRYALRNEILNGNNNNNLYTQLQRGDVQTPVTYTPGSSDA